MERRNKYNAVSVAFDGFHFDSIMESIRYKQLLLLEKCENIKNLQVHPQYELQPAYKKGQIKIRSINYEPDFIYTEGDKTIAEDVKGKETDVFKLKRKMFEYIYSEIELRIIKEI